MLRTLSRLPTVSTSVRGMAKAMRKSQQRTYMPSSDPASDFGCEQSSVPTEHPTKYDPLSVGMWRNPEQKYSPEQQVKKTSKFQEL